MEETQSLDDDQIRERLFNILQRSGIKNTVKAKLRSELIRLIGKQDFMTSLNQTKNLKENAHTIVANRVQSEQLRKTLITRLTDQLIAFHLASKKYEYSASVFNTEAGIEREAPIDVADFFEIPDATHRKLLQTRNLADLVKHLFTTKTVSLSKQTTSNEQTQTPAELLSYSEKLGVVESRRKMALDAVDRASMRELETQIENRVQAAYNRQLDRDLFKAEERVRQEERLKYEKELAEVTSQTHLWLTVQEQALLERERNQKERLASNVQLTQQEIHQQRQQVLDQAEKNAAYQKKLDVLQAELQLKESKFSKREAGLDQADARFEERVRLHRIECEHQIRNDLKSEHVELDSKSRSLMKNTNDLLEREAGVKVREKDLLTQEERYTQLQDQLRGTMEKLKASDIRQQTLQVRLDQMHDYESVKEMNGLLQAQMEAFPGKSAKDMLNIQTRWADQVTELRSLLNRVEQAQLDSHDKQVIHTNPGQRRRVVEEPISNSLDISQAYSVSSLVNEMKSRFDALSNEANALNDQYETYKTGNY